MDFNYRRQSTIRVSLVNKKRGHFLSLILKNVFTWFYCFLFPFLVSRYRNIHMIWKRVLSLKVHLHSSEILLLLLFRQIWVERFFSTSDTSQCMVAKKPRERPRSASHKSIISVRWTIMYRLEKKSPVYCTILSHTSILNLLKTRSRKSRIAFKSKEDWMFFLLYF